MNVIAGELLISGVIGAAIAQARHASLWQGFCWSLVLGPIGWIVAAIVLKPAHAKKASKTASTDMAIAAAADRAWRLAQLRAGAQRQGPQPGVIDARGSSVAPLRVVFGSMGHGSPYDDLGVAGDFPRDRLEAAVANGALVQVAYFGGRAPGTVREIGPLDIDDDHVQALCVASGQEQTYLLSRMAIPHGPAHRAYLIVLSTALRAAAGVPDSLVTP